MPTNSIPQTYNLPQGSTLSPTVIINQRNPVSTIDKFPKVSTAPTTARIQTTTSSTSDNEISYSNTSQVSSSNDH